MDLNRRKLMEIVAAAAAVAPKSSAQSPARPPQNPQDAVQSARMQYRLYAQRLATVKLPMTTEPPFHFRP